LFNTSIKENILYGELNASDEQVLKVAEMANALTFIESNVEDLTKEERLVKNMSDLKELMATLSKTRPQIATIDVNELSEIQNMLLLQVLLKADKIALD